MEVDAARRELAAEQEGFARPPVGVVRDRTVEDLGEEARFFSIAVINFRALWTNDYKESPDK